MNRTLYNHTRDEWINSILGTVLKDVSERGLSTLELLVHRSRGLSAKAIIFDEYSRYGQYSEVKDALAEVQQAQSKKYGDDPLFEGLERAKQLKTVGRRTLKTLCTASQPVVPEKQHIHGPQKAKDWQ